MAEDATHRLLRYLNDSYASEIGGLAALKDLALVASDPDLKAVVTNHIAVTESQAERVKNRILALGGDKSEPKAILNTAIAKGSSLVNAFHDRADKQTQDLIKAYAFEHFEIGAYTSLYTYATAVGDSITAELAQSIILEERDAAVQLERLIPQVAALALDNTSSQNTLIGNPKKTKTGVAAIPPAVLLVPGALLAVWGISRLLSGQSGGTSKGEEYAPTYRTNGDYVSSGEEGEPEVVGITSDYLVDRTEVSSPTGEVSSITYVVSGVGVATTDPMNSGTDLEA